MRAAPVVVLVALLGLTGCVPEREPVLPDPEPSASPIFASDEEALAAAEEAYGAYVSASDEVLKDGGVNPERIAPFVSVEILGEVLDGFKLYEENGWHTEGASTYDNVQLQQHISESSDLSSTVLYLCADVSLVRILDESGNDVTPPTRPSRVPLEVEISFTSADDALIERSDLWSGDDFCV